MAFFSGKRMRDFRLKTANEFYSQVSALIQCEQVRQLDEYIQHRCFSRLNHSIDVAYYSFFISRLFGWDSKSTARAGLLHDLFLYDCHTDDYTVKRHLRHHPEVALHNARKICELNKIEEDIIKKHMWLITFVPPRYKESYLVTFVDKYCALREFLISLKAEKRQSDIKAATLRYDLGNYLQTA